MPSLDEARTIAAAWCDAWNRRDLDTALSFYAEDVRLCSPGVVSRWGHADGWLEGRGQLRAHVSQMLASPGLHFELVDVLVGVGTMCVLYRRETGVLVCDTIEFDAAEKATCVVACYAEPGPPAIVTETEGLAVAPTIKPVALAETAHPRVSAASSLPVRASVRELAVESDISRGRGAVWAYLTRPALIARWLMPNDFVPAAGQKFTFRAPPTDTWDGVVHCEVLEIEPQDRLSYKWGVAGQGAALDTIVTWTLTDAAKGTRLRLVHAGFHNQANDAAYAAMFPDWHAMFARIERLASGSG